MVPARGCGSLEREGIGVKVRVFSKHGRNGTTWEFPAEIDTSILRGVEGGFPETEHATGSTSPVRGVSGGECDTEWARLEGMVAVLGQPALIRQVDRVRRIVHSGEHE